MCFRMCVCVCVSVCMRACMLACERANEASLTCCGSWGDAFAVPQFTSFKLDVLKLIASAGLFRE